MNYEYIEKFVSKVFNKPIDQIIYGGRQLDLVIPRHYLLWLCKQNKAGTSTAIGQRYACNHTSVTHATKNIKKFSECPSDRVCYDHVMNAWELYVNGKPFKPYQILKVSKKYVKKTNGLLIEMEKRRVDGRLKRIKTKEEKMKKPNTKRIGFKRRDSERVDHSILFTKRHASR